MNLINGSVGQLAEPLTASPHTLSSLLPPLYTHSLQDVLLNTLTACTPDGLSRPVMKAVSRLTAFGNSKYKFTVGMESISIFVQVTVSSACCFTGLLTTISADQAVVAVSQYTSGGCQ